MIKGLRWYELAPEAVLAGGLTLFLVDEPDAATSAFKSGLAVALMAAGALAWVALRLVLGRLVRWPGARVAVLTAAAGAVLAVVVLPAYDHDTVVEAFPEPVAQASAAARPTTEPGPEPAPARTGRFEGIDHRASGTVRIYRQAGDRYVVGLEDFEIQPGPNYDLYLVPGTGARSRDGGIRLDDLRGNRGTQYYDVPPGTDLAGPRTVLVWCETFGVPVAHATPA